MFSAFYLPVLLYVVKVHITTDERMTKKVE